MTSGASFWIKFLHESDLAVNNNTILKYATSLTNRFTKVEELLNIDENELIHLGITNRADRACVIKQAHLFDEKENLPLTRTSTASNSITDHWLGNNQSTPLHPQSRCHLSPALLSRISFNDHSSHHESTIINDEYHLTDTPDRRLKIDNNEKIQTLIDLCPKITSPSSAHGMRPIKSLSDTITLQKKIMAGTDRLKRLTLPRSLIKRQTALITKKVSNLTNKLINPFAKITARNDLKSAENAKITRNQVVIENLGKQIQDVDLQNDIRRSTNLVSHEDNMEAKHTVQPTHTLPAKRFKLGAPTNFLTRSLANHVHKE